MASNVNTRFVLVLAAVLSLVGVGVLGVGWFAYQSQKSPERNIQEADEAKAEGDWITAASLYGIAVNKDPKNGEYLRMWIDALSNVEPDGRTAYEQMYRSQWLLALRGLAEAEPDVIESQRLFLDERLEILERAGGDLVAWEEFQKEVDAAIDRVGPQSEGADHLSRYAVIASTELIRRATDTTDQEFDEAIAQGQAALTADATDERSAVAISQLRSLKAERHRQDNDIATASQELDTAIAELEAFLEQNPDSLVAAQQLIRARISRQSLDGATGPEIAESIRGELDALVTTAQTVDPASVDITDMANVANLLLLVDGGQAWETAESLMQRVADAKPDEPFTQFVMGQFLMRINQNQPAIQRFQTVVDSEITTLGLDGFLLSGYQAESVRLQSEATFRLWDQARTDQDEAEMERLAEQAKVYRDRLVGLVGESENSVKLIDARLAFVNNELIDARRLAAQFNDATGNRDPQGLVLLAMVLERSGSLGAAEQTYQRILELDQDNSRALLGLGQISVKLERYEEAVAYYTRAYEVTGNEQLVQIRDNLLDVIRGAGAEDPVIRALQLTDELLRQTPPDPEGAVALLERRIAEMGPEPRLSLALARILGMMGNREGALMVVREALPNAEGSIKRELERRERVLAASTPEELEAYIKNELESEQYAYLTPAQKAITKSNWFARRGMNDQAEAAFQEAVALDEDDPVVLTARFERAVADRDIELARELGERAGLRNLDKANGRLYEAQIMLLEENYEDAATTLESVVEQDKFHFDSWRVLGNVRMIRGEFEQAYEAYGQANAIKPNVVQVIVGRLRTAMATGRFEEALRFARENSQAGMSSAEFVEMWVRLESSVAGGDEGKALELRRSLLTRNPQNLTNRIGYISLLMDNNRWEEAREQIDELSASDTDPLITAELESRWYAEQGQVDAAEQVYRVLVDQTEPGDRTGEAYMRASTMLAQRGQVDKAVLWLNEGRKHQSDQREVDRELGDLLFATDRYEEAIESYERVLESETLERDTELKTRKRLAETYLRTRDLDGAERVIAGFGEGADTDQELLLLSAAIQDQRGNTEEARRLYDRAVRADTQSPGAYVQRGRFNERDPRLARDVEADFRQAVQLSNNDPRYLALLAEFYISEGRIDDGIREYQNALAGAQDNSAIRQRLSRLYVQQGRFDEALDLLYQAARDEPNNAAWRVGAGQTNAIAGRWKRAETDLAQAWATWTTPNVGLEYVRVLLEQPSPDINKAVEVLNSDTFRSLAGPERALLLAWAASVAGEPGQSEGALREALSRTDQTDPGPTALFVQYLNRAFQDPSERVAVMERIRPEDGYTQWMLRAYLQARIQRGDSLSEVAPRLEQLAQETLDEELAFSSHLLAAQSAYGAKDFKLAEKHYRAAHDIAPDNWQINNDLAFVLASDLDNAQAALPFAERAAELNRRNANVQDTLGFVYMELDRVEQAERAFRAAMGFASNDLERAAPLIHLGMLKTDTGEQGEARRLADQAESIFRESPEIRARYQDLLETLKARL